MTSFPHKCPSCNKPAYVGLASISCSSQKCKYYDAGDEAHKLEVSAGLPPIEGEVTWPMWKVALEGWKSALMQRFNYLPHLTLCYIVRGHVADEWDYMGMDAKADVAIFRGVFGESERLQGIPKAPSVPDNHQGYANAYRTMISGGAIATGWPRIIRVHFYG